MATLANRNAFASSVDKIPTSGTTLDLARNQVGVFDKNLVATDGSVDSIYIAQGTPDESLSFAGFNNLTLKSPLIHAKAVKSFKKKQGKAPQPMIWETGELLVPLKNTTFGIAVSVTGDVAQRLMGMASTNGNARFVDIVTASLPCPSGVSACEEITCGQYHSENAVADAVIDAWKGHKFIGGTPLNDMIEISKVILNPNPSAQPTVTYDKYTLTLTDGGGITALAAVQSQYPDYKVVQVVSGLVSVYEITVPDSVTPEDYVANVTPVIPNCSTCPDGYSLVDKLDTYIVKRALLPDDDVSTPTDKADYAADVESDYSAEASVYLTQVNGEAWVQIWVTEGTSVPALNSDLIQAAGTAQAVCKSDSATEVAWESAGECKRAIRNFTLTIKDNDCGGTYLTQLQAEYGDVTLVSTANCVSVYNLPVESNELACSSCSADAYSWTAPSSFAGSAWVAEELPDLGGTVKLRFTSIYEQRQIQECFYREVAYEYQPLQFTIGQYDPEILDPKAPCKTLIPAYQIQAIGYAFGLGIQVANLVYESNFKQGWYWSCDPAVRDAINYALMINFGGFYDQYVLEFVHYPDTEGGDNWLTHHTVFEQSVFFRQGAGSDFETVIGAFAAQNGVALEIVA